LDDEHMLQKLETWLDLRDPVAELPVRDERAQVGVVEQVPQLVLDVPVVDVDRHRPQLERGDHHFEVLDRVVQEARDVIAGPDATRRERVRESGRALVGVRERQAAIGVHEGLVVGNGVGDSFPEIREVELHCGGP
jgi:hypothetical protein